MLVFDLFLQIQRVDFEVLDIDYKIKSLVETFESSSES